MGENKIQKQDTKTAPRLQARLSPGRKWVLPTGIIMIQPTLGLCSVWHTGCSNRLGVRVWVCECETLQIARAVAALRLAYM